ncbi:MAG TPA: hypothetical protein VN026_13640, partial [Bacteroidia bacterium]|nr:hypothetical protein [Bacteroidia bacterium]
MKNIKLKIFLGFFLIALSISTSYGQAVAFCPSISAFTPTAPLCASSCATISANVIPVNQTTSYSVQSIPYFPFAYTGGTPVSVGIDDVWSSVINLGFNFCYFGNTYNQCLLGSNGQLTFSISPPLPGGYDNWLITTAIPNLSDMPGNTICAVFRDIDPSFGGNMRYYFSGTSPCRALVIYWDSIPLYSNPGSCSGKPNSTFQLVLYENTNYIDVYIQNSTACANWNGGKGIVGIQNISGTVAYTPPLRNYPSVWTATNEAWRFVPTGAQSYTVTWSGPSGIIGTGLTQTVCPSVNTTYTASMNVNSCSGVNSTYTSAVTVTVSPNPPPVITQGTLTQLSCSTFTNSDNVILSSGSPGYTVNWSPSPVTTNSTATTFSATGMSPGTNIISVVDAFGCTATQTVNITPPPTVPSFSIAAPSGTVTGCLPPTVPLNAINTNTNITSSSMSYTWTSATQPSSVTSSYNGFGNTTYTISGSAPGTCISTQTFAVSQNTTAPTITVNPITASITCNGACKTFTATTAANPNVF